MDVLPLPGPRQPGASWGSSLRLHQGLVLPVPSPPIPLLVGGRSRAALRRAALRGDGWLPVFVSPRRFRDSVKQIEEMAAAAGRRLSRSPTLSVWCGLDGDAPRARRLLATALEQLYSLPYEDFRHITCAGTPAIVAEALAAHVEAGSIAIGIVLVDKSRDSVVRLATQELPRPYQTLSSSLATASMRSIFACRR